MSLYGWLVVWHVYLVFYFIKFKRFIWKMLL
ncbi:hypothetical protein BRC2024_KCUCJSVR_CDS_0182 [Acinetobacter phage vB_AbaM_KissB]